MSKNLSLEDVASEASNRRRFVAKLGLAGAVAASATSLLGQDNNTSLVQAMANGTITDADILNFALNLEYLEAEFYTVATQGKTIDQLGIGVDGTSGAEGPTTGGARVHFPDAPNYSLQVAMEVAADERAHVTLIRKALQSAGESYIAKPEINLNALGMGFADARQFFALARIFEDIGVSAYGGAAPLISNKAILGVAARILAAEAEHVAAIRLQVARYVISTTMLDSVDILPLPSGKRITSLDSNGLSAVRTPGQVLALAYAAANVKRGGFFPKGVNGAINMSSARA